MRNKFKVSHYDDHEGMWKITNPHGLICCGGWKTKEDAQKSCDKYNNRKSSWEIS
jgi:hypothetical protein